MNQLISYVLYVTIHLGVHNNDPGTININASDRRVIIPYEQNYYQTGSNEYRITSLKQESGITYLTARSTSNDLYWIFIAVMPDYVIMGDMLRMKPLNNGPVMPTTTVYYRNKNGIKNLHLTDVKEVIDHGFEVLNRE